LQTASPDKALQETALLAKRFVALAFCRADLFFELNDDHKICFAAGATPSVFGKSTHEMTGMDFLDLIHADDCDMVAHLLMTASAEGRFDDVSTRMITLKNGAAEAAIAGYRVPDFDNNFFLAVKITPKKRAEPRRRETDRDTEAQVLNADSYKTVAASRLKDFETAGGEAKVTMVKIDNLETLKQDLSQQDQTKLMTAIGGILRQDSLGGDTAGRIDDESFSFVHDKNVDIEQVGQKIEDAAKEITPDGVQINSQTTSISGDTEGLNEEQIAKAIAYTMKSFSSGQNIAQPANMTSMFEKMMAETTKQIDAFRKICATKNFDLVYMPICHLNSGRVHHFEALTRFKTGSGEESPYQLITLAEEIGVISEFDLVVAQKAIDFIIQRATKGYQTPIAVNVSGHSIQDKDFLKELHALVKKATNVSRMLMFEITESAEILDLESVNASIQEFRQKGFKFALDDFGAGAASFDYLNSFDVDTVKFDGPVVKRAYATDKGKAFLASMATLCRETGVETIAEMVEDEPLATFLKDCGIDLGQGYYFGRPERNVEAFRDIM